eukprot:XP_011664749.1 PREDICTED: uncharacterized oxidoreductase C24B10.20-like [Strongylocentrotus purpuratus]
MRSVPIHHTLITQEGVDETLRLASTAAQSDNMMLPLITPLSNQQNAQQRYGGWYSYRMSKSALNMATKNLSIEFSRGRRKVVCISLHPGTVNTDLSRPYHKNVAEDKLFTPEYSVERMMEVIENLNVEDSGKFLDFAGKEIPF